MDVRPVALQQFSDRITEWQGDHNHACEGPSTSRTVHIADFSELFWWCAPNGPDTGHVMTTLNTPSYGIAAFSPNQAFVDVSQVCVDVSLTMMGGGRWAQVVIVPEHVFQRNGRRLDYVGPDFRFPNAPGAFNTQDIAETFGFKIAPGVDGTSVFSGIEAWQGVNHIIREFRGGYATYDKAARYRHCLIDNGNGTVTVTQQAPTRLRSWTAAGALPDGPVRVIFEDDNYDPPKRTGYDPSRLTWHWDNIVIS